MIYREYTIGGELMHSAKGVEWKNKKYIDKVKTKTGKWRYIYSDTYKNEGKKYYKKATTNRNYKKGKELGLISDMSSTGKNVKDKVQKVLDKIITKKSRIYKPEEEVKPWHNSNEYSTDKLKNIITTKSRIYKPEEEVKPYKEDKKKKKKK